MVVQCPGSSRDIPASMPSPATDPGPQRIPLAGTGEPRFHGFFRSLGVKSVSLRPVRSRNRPGVSDPNPTAHPAGMGEAITRVKEP